MFKSLVTFPGAIANLLIFVGLCRAWNYFCTRMMTGSAVFSGGLRLGMYFVFERKLPVLLTSEKSYKPNYLILAWGLKNWEQNKTHPKWRWGNQIHLNCLVTFEAWFLFCVGDIETSNLTYFKSIWMLLTPNPLFELIGLWAKFFLHWRWCLFNLQVLWEVMNSKCLRDTWWDPGYSFIHKTKTRKQKDLESIGTLNLQPFFLP